MYLKKIDPTPEQRKIFFLEPNKPVLLSGRAGSGKTTTAILRAAQLVRFYERQGLEPRVGFFVYYNTLKTYLNTLANIAIYKIRLPLLAGAYSDDTQLTLATARSLKPDGTFDVEFFANLELSVWLLYQLGGGTGTKTAARNLMKKNVAWYNNFYYTSYTQYTMGGGNGAAMRILPIALVNITNPRRRHLDIWRNTVATHGHPRGLASLGCYDRRTKGAGHATGVAAIFFLCRLNNFEEGILAVANEIGLDTDTIGYFVGAMFGACYGLETIPLHFQNHIQDADYLLKLADWCHKVASNTVKDETLFTYPSSQDIDIPQNVEALFEKHPNLGLTFDVPVLGRGKLVKDSDVTPHWTGKHVHWLQSQLDLGQTIFLQIDRQLSST